MADVLGVVVEHAGNEYLVRADSAGMPDILRRDDSGEWVTLKKKGPGGQGGWTAQELLAALTGEDVPVDHTQQQIKRLVLLCVTKVIHQFFDAARWG
jgi:hypothetical protein